MGSICALFLGNPGFKYQPGDSQVLFKFWPFSSIPLSGVPRGGLGGFNPPPEIPKALQNHAKLNPIVKTVNDWFERIMWEILITFEQAVTLN